MRLRHLAASSALGATLALAAPPDTFHESLTLQPLPDGKLSVLFEFTTHFSLHTGPGRTREASTGSKLTEAQSHHSLTSPSLLLPLEHNNVSELTVSFTSGQWHAHRHGEAGPLAYEAGGAGADVRGWLEAGSGKSAEAWDAVTSAFGGLFCAGVGADDMGEVVTTYGALYPPARQGDNLTHYLVSTPHLHLCTENLTPFLALLPSKGVSGLSALLAQPGVVLSWGFKTEGIDVVMPRGEEQGTWTGWWEGVVDLVPHRGGSRQFSINSLFKRDLPRSFPGASSSVLRVIRPAEEAFVASGDPTRAGRWVDGTYRAIDEWNLQDNSLAGTNVEFSWSGEGDFTHPQRFEPPAITIARLAADRHASDATFRVEITNNAKQDRPVVYSEIWPWWVKGWISEMEVRVDKTSRRDLLHGMQYHPSIPPTPSTTTLHLNLTLPALSTVTLEIPFSKLTLKYTDHRPDAERGREIPASVLTLWDIEGEDGNGQPGEADFRRSARRHIHGPKLLLDVPTPDFSMPYNVIIMTSTVMAVFFGSIHGRLVRRWAWVPKEKTQ